MAWVQGCIRLYLRYKLSPVWKVKTEKEGKEERGKGKRIPLKAGLDKVPYPPPRRAKFNKAAGEEYQVVKSGRDFYVCWEKHNVEKKGKREQYHLPCIIRAVGKRTEINIL